MVVVCFVGCTDCVKMAPKKKSAATKLSGGSSQRLAAEQRHREMDATIRGGGAACGSDRVGSLTKHLLH